jgi:DNA-directed RNA polymerase subunit RPC12/RpoP
VRIVSEIVCIDCGGRCGLLTSEPPGGFRPGDVVAYRCSECLDRWDLEITEDDIEDAPDPGDRRSF